MQYSQPVSANPRGTNLSRYIRALVLSRGSMSEAKMIAEEWRDSPQVLLTLRAMTDPLLVSNVSALATFGISQELIAAITGVSVLGRIQDKLNRVPMRVKIPRA